VWRSYAVTATEIYSKENLMRMFVRAASLATSLLLPALAGLAAPPQNSKAAPGSIVIVFKDGHRQSFNLSDIQRVEFPTADFAATTNPSGPSRGHFLGKWEVGDGSGNTFYITLFEDGKAKRTLGDVRGTWTYSNGDALITWDDGAQDAIRKVGSHFQKFAYHAGKSFTDDPDNVTSARNTMPSPI
jgi:hypothetical protein